MQRVVQLTSHLKPAEKQGETSSLLELRSRPDDVRAVMRQPDQFDVNEMKRWLDHDNLSMRDEFRRFLASDSLFQNQYDLKLMEYRTLALQRLKAVCSEPGHFISVFDFQTNPQRVFAVHELACMVDGSLATKITVQFNLFGGTVLKLGTERHRFILDKIDSVDLCGCFCLTELGYGNNAVKLETTATFDPRTQEFVIHTPTPNAAKYWITNGALDAHYAVVFAQTIVEGKNEGVCGFLVQIRSIGQDHKVMPGVTIRDMGPKQGQNGVDNAQILFSNVRVPKEAILNQRVDIDNNGRFVSDIKSPRGRFLVALNQLYSGRLCLASKAVGRAKQALAVAIRYSWSRLSTGPKGESDFPIMGFQLQERALMPELARTYVLAGFGMNYVKDLYAKETTVGGKGLGQLRQETMVLCSGVKALVTASAERTISICRERCGGAGYSKANVFAEALNDAHAVMTAEGDNKVLLQKTAKEALAFHQQGLVALPSDLDSGFSGSKDLSNLGFLLHLFWRREAALVRHLDTMMKKKKADGSFFDTWVLNASDDVQALAVAYLERVILEQFCSFLEKECKPSIRGMLEKLGILFALQSIEANMTVFITFDVIDSTMVRAILPVAREVSHEISLQSLQLVEAFAIPEALLPPAARDWVKWNSQDHNGEVLGFDF